MYHVVLCGMCMFLFASKVTRDTSSFITIGQDSERGDD